MANLEFTAPEYKRFRSFHFQILGTGFPFIYPQTGFPFIYPQTGVLFIYPRTGFHPFSSKYC